MQTEAPGRAKDAALIPESLTGCLHLPQLNEMYLVIVIDCSCSELFPLADLLHDQISPSQSQLGAFERLGGMDVLECMLCCPSQATPLALSPSTWHFVIW